MALSEPLPRGQIEHMLGEAMPSMHVMTQHPISRIVYHLEALLVQRILCLSRRLEALSEPPPRRQTDRMMGKTMPSMQVVILFPISRTLYHLEALLVQEALLPTLLGLYMYHLNASVSANDVDWVEMDKKRS